MKKNIVFFEVKGGSDKGEDGYRKDTMPMVNAVRGILKRTCNYP
ncbi:hypothetical protein B10628_19810 [Campylobacter jejuni]|nr:hypothetical protein B10628_19810 [Campylobacter jejuni]